MSIVVVESITIITEPISGQCPHFTLPENTKIYLAIFGRYEKFGLPNWFNPFRPDLSHAVSNTNITLA